MLNKPFLSHQSCFAVAPPPPAPIKKFMQQELKGLSGNWLLASDLPSTDRPGALFYEVNDGYFTYSKSLFLVKTLPLPPKESSAYNF